MNVRDELETALRYTRREVKQLERAREAAIAHLMRGDMKGALVALIMQRDTPLLFDLATFDE